MLSRAVKVLGRIVAGLTALVWLLAAQGAAAAFTEPAASLTEPAASFHEPAASPGEPGGGRHELTLRLRYPDGRAASGRVVNLRRAPDREIVGWEFADNACRSDERGECRWLVWSGLYEFEFAEGLQPDSLTLAAAGGHGLHGLGVYLDRDFTVGLVLADPLTGGAGETLFFDQSPEAALPVYRVPAWEDLEAREEAAAKPTWEAERAAEGLAPDTGAEAGAGASADGAAVRGGFSWPLLLTALLLAGGALFFFRRARNLPPPMIAAKDGASTNDAPTFGASVNDPPAAAEAETETES